MNAHLEISILIVNVVNIGIKKNQVNIINIIVLKDAQVDILYMLRMAQKKNVLNLVMRLITHIIMIKNVILVVLIVIF